MTASVPLVVVDKAASREIRSYCARNRRTARFLGGLLKALCDLRDRRAAAVSHVLDRAPGLTGGQHAGNFFISIGVFRAPLVATFGFRLSLTLSLPAAPIDVVLAGDRREHVEQHTVDGFEHAAGELVAGIAGHHPGRR